MAPKRITATYDRDLLATAPSPGPGLSGYNNYDLSILSPAHGQPPPADPSPVVQREELKMETAARPPHGRTKKIIVVVALVALVVIAIAVGLGAALVSSHRRNSRTAKGPAKPTITITPSSEPASITF